MSYIQYLLLKIRVSFVRFCIRTGIITLFFKIKETITSIIIALRLCKRYDSSQTIKIHARWLDHKTYLLEKDNKKKYRRIYQRIAEASDKTGIPQWELRAYLERETNAEL